MTAAARATRRQRCWSRARPRPTHQLEPRPAASRSPTPGGPPITETVTGIYADNQLLGPLLVDGDVYRAADPAATSGRDEVVLVNAAPGADLPRCGRTSRRRPNRYYVVNVQTATEFKGPIAGQVNGLIGLLYGLLGLAIVIAILGIVNTLALSVVERRREIGMLRAVGMQRKQVRRTIYLESLLIAVFGAVLGLALGLSYGALFTKALHGQGLDRLSVPWGQSVLFLVLAAIVGVLAALWPGIRARADESAGRDRRGLSDRHVRPPVRSDWRARAGCELTVECVTASPTLGCRCTRTRARSTRSWTTRTTRRACSTTSSRRSRSAATNWPTSGRPRRTGGVPDRSRADRVSRASSSSAPTAASSTSSAGT